MLTHSSVCRKFSVDNQDELETFESDVEKGIMSPSRTPSGRKSRKMNTLNLQFGSRYRNPDNETLLMGENQTLGKAYAILAVMMHGPDLPTELSQHKERLRIFIAAAPYALLADEITAVLAYQDSDLDEIRVYLLGLLTTACRPLSTLLYNDARDFFQTEVFMSGTYNAEYRLHLGLGATTSVIDQ